MASQRRGKIPPTRKPRPPRTKLVPYKFIIQPVAQRVGASGKVLGELGAGEIAVIEIFGCAELEQWAREFPAKLAKAQSELQA